MIPKNEVRNQILLLFRIFINDIDEDGSSSWSEKYLWGLDPLEWSTDGDNIPDGYEVIHNLDPHHYSNEESNDLDSDALIDKVEYDNRRHGSTPNRKDIFVEVDWMKENDGTQFRFKEESQNMVIYSFAKQNIGLHIDDGCMGGGNSITMTDELKYLEESEEDVLLSTHFDNTNRGGIFFYCIFAYRNSPNEGSGSGILGESGKPFIVFDATRWDATDQAHTFMHELGHNLIKGPNRDKHNFDGHEHCENKCAMNSGTDYVQYCDPFWEAIEIDPW